jgi:hypothetical protein
MTVKLATATTTSLATATNMTPAQVEVILNAAGLKPATTTARSGDTRRTWPRVEALKIIRASEPAHIKDLRDRIAHDRAAIVTIKEGLKTGVYARLTVWILWIQTFADAVKLVFDRMPSRYAAPVAAINARRLPDKERRAEIRKLFEPDLDAVRAAGRRRP